MGASPQRLSAWNLYPLAPLGLAAWLAALATRQIELMPVAAGLASGGVVAAGLARRYRLSALGAGGELREFERARVSVWAALAARARAGGARTGGQAERTRIVGQGELVRERRWPQEEPFVPMTGDGRGRIPRRDGRHLLIVGATGSGKTVSARRWLLARIVADGVAVLATDPKGDRGLEEDLRAAARWVGRPLVVLRPARPRRGSLEPAVER